MFISGIADSINAYPHGLSYTPGGTRLHISWCWRETPDANTNHDLFYATSDDHGRTFKNDAGTTIATTGSAYISKSSSGAKVWTIGQNRGLINQEHMTIDRDGRVHVLLSHMPDGQADDSNFDRSRGKSEFFHYMRATDGTWSRHPMGLPVVANLRGKLASARSGNLYAASCRDSNCTCRIPVPELASSPLLISRCDKRLPRASRVTRLNDWRSCASSARGGRPAAEFWEAGGGDGPP